MFKMKYLINKMQCNILSMVGAFASIFKVKRSNLTSGVCVVNNGKLIGYSPI